MPTEKQNIMVLLQKLDSDETHPYIGPANLLLGEEQFKTSGVFELKVKQTKEKHHVANS